MRGCPECGALVMLSASGRWEREDVGGGRAGPRVVPGGGEAPEVVVNL